MMINFSIFPRITQPQGHTVNCEWPEFVNLYLTSFETRTHKDGKLYSPAVYPAGNVKRTDSNVVGMSGICVDFDNSKGRGNDAMCSESPTMPVDHLDNLDGLTYAIHSTYSNSKNWPKWRLVLIFNRIATPQEYQHLIKYVRFNLLGNDPNIDATCFELSRAFYCPSCPAENIGDSFSIFQDGQPIDIDKILETPIPQITNIPQQPVNVVQLPTHKYEGRNDALKAQVAAMLAKGKTLDQMVKELIEYDQRTHNPPLFSDKAEGMRADPWTNAAKFIVNNLESINSRRLAQGERPQTTLKPIVAPYNLNWLKDVEPKLKNACLVKGFLGLGGTSIFYGDSNTGKTFLVADLALHVAAGMEWQGMRTIQGPVIYVVAEGGALFANRIYAWKKHHKTDSAPFAYIEHPINLLDPNADTPRLIELLKDLEQNLGQAPVLIVIDTLSRALSGGNENSSEDMGALANNITLLASQTKAHVLTIHHSGKDQAKGARGHSLLRAAIDSEIEISRVGTEPAKVRNTKQRDFERAQEFDFILLPVEVGHNEDGERVSSCVVLKSIGVDLPAKAKGKNAEALSVLADMFHERRQNLIESGHDETKARVTYTEWKDEMRELGIFGKSEKQEFYRIKEKLKADCLIFDQGPYVFLSENGNQDGKQK